MGRSSGFFDLAQAGMAARTLRAITGLQDCQARASLSLYLISVRMLSICASTRSSVSDAISLLKLSAEAAGVRGRH
jgi:hypothetical protein